MGSEFRGHRLLIFSAAIGLSTGMTATMFYSLGALIAPLQQAFGWGRGDISLCVTLMTVALFLFGPAAGRLCDRHGAALVGSVSLLAYAGAVITLALFVRDVELFWLSYFIIAALGAGSTPIVLIRPISAAFDRHRGLAMGIALTGAGLAGFWVPNLVAQVAAAAGWQAAYLALAGTALVAAPIVWFGFRSADAGRTPSVTPETSAAGLTASEARRTREYWLLSAMALAMATGIAGMVVHLVPLFEDLGASGLDAARTASLVGLSSVVGRILVGVLLDRFAPRLVSLAILALAALGIALLWLAGLQAAWLSAVLLGLAAGAEIDLLAYLTSLYFGQRAYGAIYGWQYSTFALGYGFSPFLVGQLRDRLGNYDAATVASATLMGLSALASLGLRPRRRCVAEAVH